MSDKMPDEMPPELWAIKYGQWCNLNIWGLRGHLYIRADRYHARRIELADALEKRYRADVGLGTLMDEVIRYLRDTCSG